VGHLGLLQFIFNLYYRRQARLQVEQLRKEIEWVNRLELDDEVKAQLILKTLQKIKLLES
jgi:hypothetical protein